MTHDPAALAFLRHVAQQGGQCAVPESGDEGRAAQAALDAGLLKYVTVRDPFVHFQLQLTDTGRRAAQA